jgi:hypothetical protein
VIRSDVPMVDLYCRYFRDVELYRRWEPLLDGEQL